MHLRRSSIWKYLLAFCLGASLYSEWLVYKIQPLFWNTLNCKDEKTCIKILMIADPQIQGDTAVPPPLSYLFNWDSDRYLQSTYSVVEKHFKPDVLVFLGDLMDEGSIATMPQFHSYVKRLFNIFDPQYPVVQIWIPGDNDIGGENEIIKQDKVIEFNKVFSQPSIIVYRNISFYKVGTILNAVPQPLDDGDLNFKIALSHYPLLQKSYFAKRVIESIHPDVFFCAHDHTSKYVKQKRDFSYKETHLLQYNDPVLTVPLDDGEDYYEIYVPTCSYRMGTSQIGFGAVIIENNNEHLKYTIFWSPKRFVYLFVYLLIIILVVIYAFYTCFLILLSRFSRIIKTEDMKYLLQRNV